MQKSYQILIQRLNEFIKEYYKNLIVRGFIYSFFGMISVLIFFGLIEHFNFFNGLVRSILFWSYCIIALLIIARFILFPAIKMLRIGNSLTYKDAAKIIGLHFQDVSDKLTNILELKDISGGNEPLIHASINQKIKEIELTPFKRAIDWGATINFSKYLFLPILIIVLLFVSGNQKVISDSTFRIMKYNTYFDKPAPFYFELDSDSLIAVENENFTININISGDEIPQEVYVNFNNQTKKMDITSQARYSYTFKNLQETTYFYLEANNEYSKKHKLVVLGRPEIENMKITITPPAYTKIKKEVKTNMGSLSVPEGTRLVWEIEVDKADTLSFYMNRESTLLTQKINNSFRIEKKIEKESQYHIALANKNVSFIDTTFYNIKIIPDNHPIISINRQLGSGRNGSSISGVIHDDYGFFDLQSFKRIYGLNRDTIIQKSINIEKGLRSQSFLHTITPSEPILHPGESMDYYFIVRDNDTNNGYKSSRSETFTLNAPTTEEIQEQYEENNQIIKNDITVEMSLLKELEKELLDFEKNLIEKDSLDWRDKKRLEEILKQQSNLERKIEQLKESSKSNFDELNSISPPSEEMLKKQQELESVNSFLLK